MLTLVLSLLLLAPPDASAAPTTAPTSAPSSQPSGLITVGDEAAIKAAMTSDKDVTITGVVDTAEWSKSGKVFRVTFVNGQVGFQAVVFKQDSAAFAKEYPDLAKAFAGKRLTISGKVVDYKGSAEIVLKTPKQIVKVEEK
jgi:DNA/RNA endonuclease YhcR with UshA esterase domain